MAATGRVKGARIRVACFGVRVEAILTLFMRVAGISRKYGEHYSDFSVASNKHDYPISRYRRFQYPALPN